MCADAQRLAPQTKLDAARAKAGADMMKYMMQVLPVALAIQKGVMEKYGFPPTQPGAFQFVAAVQKYQDEDAEIKRLTAQLKKSYMPTKASPSVHPPALTARTLDLFVLVHGFTARSGSLVLKAPK